MEPRLYGFLTYVKERTVPLVIVTRSSEKKNIGHMWMGLYDFERIEIKNLDQRRAYRLIDCCASRFNLKLGADLKAELFTISKGNPKLIKQLCCLARDEKYSAKGYLDVKLMDLDRRISSAVR